MKKNLRKLSEGDKDSLLSTVLSSGEVLGSVREEDQRGPHWERVAALKTFI